MSPVGTAEPQVPLSKQRGGPAAWGPGCIRGAGSTLFLPRFLVHSFLKLTLETFCLVVVKYY